MYREQENSHLGWPDHTLFRTCKICVSVQVNTRPLAGTQDAWPNCCQAQLQAYLILLHFAFLCFSDIACCFFFFYKLKVFGNRVLSDDG